MINLSIRTNLNIEGSEAASGLGRKEHLPI